MKTRFTFLLLLFILMSKAQVTPAYVTTLTTDSNIWINSSCLDTKNKIMYLCYAESGFIKKLDLATNVQTMAVSGLSYPICSAVIGNRLYFLEATNGLDQNNMPIPNTGKLSYIDLTQSNPQVVTLMNGLNIPTRVAGSTDFLVIDENTISSTNPNNMDVQQLSQINLTGNITKTPIISRKWDATNPNDEAFDHFEIVGNVLYSNSYHYTNLDENNNYNANFYKVSLDTKSPTVLRSFTSHGPYSFGINQETFYFSDGEGPGNNYKMPLDDNKVSSITTNFKYNNEGISVYGWNFDSNGDAYLLSENGNGSIFVFKYTNQQLLQLSDLSKPASFNFFPNPVVDVLHITTELKDINVYDANGDIVLKNPTNTKEINLRHLSPGNYILTGKDASQKLGTIKFIKK